MNEYAVWAGPIIAAVALIYTFVGNKTKKHDEKFRGFEDKFLRVDSAVAGVNNSVVTLQRNLELRVDGIEDRTLRVESTIAHMPNKDVTHSLELMVGELRGDVKALTESIKPIRAIADRVQEAILERVANTA